MTDFKVAVKTRNETARKARHTGLIPAVVYGKNFDNKNIEMSKIDFLKMFRESGTSNLIDLDIDGKENVKTLIQDVQHHFVNNEIIHVDFLKVNMKEKIHAEIPLKFVGDSPAVINLDGSLITSKDSIEVECLPGDLIPEIEVDIAILDDFEKNIKVADLKVPVGIEIQDDPEEVVTYVQEPRSEEEMAGLEEAVEEKVDEVEVEHKGEAEAEGEGAEGEAPAEGGEKPSEPKQE